MAKAGLGHQANAFSDAWPNRKSSRKGMSIALANLIPRHALLDPNALAQAPIIAELPPHVHLRSCVLVIWTGRLCMCEWRRGVSPSNWASISGGAVTVQSLPV